jgi:tRNA (Thr-GGU) A37 N-methylase
MRSRSLRFLSSHCGLLPAQDSRRRGSLVSKPPPGNPNWPRVGIFAQRKKDRPNKIGVSICELLEVKGLTLKVRALDAIDGTPVLDIKPYVKEFIPDSNQVRQPRWVTELMTDYYAKS